MARMRSLPKAAEELKAKDPETDVSYWVLRRWVKEKHRLRHDLADEHHDESLHKPER